MSQDHSLWADAVTIAEITKLRADLAEREAEIAKLREYLHELACLGNGDIYGNSIGNCLAIEALATPQSTSYLEQWEKDCYGEPVIIEEPEYHCEAMGCGLEDRNITDRYEAMRHGWDCAIERMFEQIPDGTLYARKD